MTARVKSVLQQWDDIFKEIKSLQSDVELFKSGLTNHKESSKQPARSLINQGINLCIYADPMQPPYSLNALVKLLGEQYNISVSVFVHSSMHNIPDDLKNFFPENGLKDKCENVDIKLRLVWKPVGLDPSLVVSPVNGTTILGEVNIARYLCSLIDGDLSLNFDSSLGCPLNILLIDHWLDSIHKNIVHGKQSDFLSIEKIIKSKLNESLCIINEKVSVVDLCLWSALKNMQLEKKIIHQYSKWYEKISPYFL
ncbi:hypothetical protein J437_LFUL003004 [Ladona fulva]|uniref:AIMP2 thioredoxin-like domain-containing protein n=1 Tax=Ladona fulva TaxID=123851 RepID=A0A8K0JU67_LADFU|nr:hypothetical protein J437_LFUL003004 [Ladona fulva]